MATNNSLYVFDNYTPNVFYNRGPMITTPYENYPFMEHPSKTKAASQGQLEGYEKTCTTFNQDIPVYVPCMYNSLGDERHGIPVQEQPLDMCTDLLPSHPWLNNGGKLKLQLNSVSNVARQYGLTIPDTLEFHFLTRSQGSLIMKHKTIAVNYIWERSVSTSIAFLTIQFPGYIFNDLTF